MDLKSYYQQLTTTEKRRIADKCNRKLGYLRHVFHGRKKAGPHLAIELEQATNGEVTREELRPDLFATRKSAA